MHVPLLLALSIAAPAAPPPAASDPSADAAAYCDYVTSAAASDAAILVAPDLVGGVGWAHETEELYGLGPVDQLHGRVLVGMRYSLAGLRRGMLLRARGDAECQRYRTVSGLRQFLQVGSKLAAREPLKRRAEVLRAALERGGEILAEEDALLRSGVISAIERDATALRLDALRALAAEANRALAALPAVPVASAPPVQELMAQRPLDEARVERVEGALRRSYAWDVELRGGYDKVIGLEEDRVPVFGMVSVSLNLGAVWQGFANARAVGARTAWAAREVEGVVDRAALALRALEAELAGERQRLGETRVLVADLRARLESVASVPGEKVAHYRNQLWFDFVKTDAEHAYLEAHVRSLTALVGEAGPMLAAGATWGAGDGGTR